MRNVPRIKLDTKKVMAYRKSVKHDDEYELYNCHHCGEEYLSQGIKDNEQLFCPKHSDYQICVWCDVTAKESEMKIQDAEFYCSECFAPKCRECGEPASNLEDQFCSDECRKGFWGDSTEY